MVEQFYLKDNFIDSVSFKNLQNNIVDNMFFPWFYNDFKVYQVSDKNFNQVSNVYDYQFVHIFYSHFTVKSDFFNVLEPLLQKINPASIVMIKANLTMAAPSVMKYTFHNDYQVCEKYNGLKTAIFYLNTNDGLTIFEDGTTLNSVENRLVAFNYNKKHTGSTTTNKRRIVLNINYF